MRIATAFLFVTIFVLGECSDSQKKCFAKHFPQICSIGDDLAQEIIGQYETVFLDDAAGFNKFIEDDLHYLINYARWIDNLGEISSAKPAFYIDDQGKNHTVTGKMLMDRLHWTNEHTKSYMSDFSLGSLPAPSQAVLNYRDFYQSQETSNEMLSATFLCLCGYNRVMSELERNLSFLQDQLDILTLTRLQKFVGTTSSGTSCRLNEALLKFNGGFNARIAEEALKYEKDIWNLN